MPGQRMVCLSKKLVWSESPPAATSGAMKDGEMNQGTHISVHQNKTLSTLTTKTKKKKKKKRVKIVVLLSIVLLSETYKLQKKKSLCQKGYFGFSNRLHSFESLCSFSSPLKDIYGLYIYIYTSFVPAQCLIFLDVYLI